MRKVLAIARKEYLETVKTKAFIIGIFFVPILMVGIILLKYLVFSFGQDCDICHKRYPTLKPVQFLGLKVNNPGAEIIIRVVIVIGFRQTKDINSAGTFRLYCLFEACCLFFF